MKMFPSYIWLAAYRGQGFTESVHQFQSTNLLSNKCDIYLIFFPQRKSNREPVVAVHSSAVFLIITSRFYWMADYWQALFDSRPPRMSLKPPVLHFPFPRTLALLSVYQCWPKWLPDERLMSWSVACGLEREFSLRLLWGGMAEGQTTTDNSLEASYTLWRGESWYRARLSDFLRTQTVHNQVAECCLCLTPVCMTLKTGTFLYQIVSARPWPGNGHLLTFVTSSLSEPSVNLLLSKRYQNKFQ